MTTAAQPVGAHLDSPDPLAAAAELGADAVQFFLTEPQGWVDPPERDDAAAFASSEIAVFIHAPYRINIASTNNRIRIPSRKLLASHAAGAAAIGARGLIVHGGHVGDSDDAATGFDNWRKFFERAGELPVPVLIENTAGGDNAMARTLDQIGRLWDAVGEFGAGFCLDTCHAFAAGIELAQAIEQIKSITGRIDLVHANGSRDPFGSTRDRHANFGGQPFGAGADNQIDPELIGAVVAEAGAPAIVETAPAGQRADIAAVRAALH
ncbi:deoxyribonuclease IV [Nakamurella aerolata]|uniref:Deoxyribonuclease IV n=1 Tax=Nakamurella aerolata TaxID=1656892 RepID=A0A849A7S7_9ACTN|nr:deoxyribonuclease IV [Nakamurella aerolata]NNG36077.1 deoxyribonuclease IV [Nakamurella aerolata]